MESERKVLLIDPADRLNPSSANSLLKLIEEPPKAMAILMATESIHSILPTIRSRAARLRLRPAPEQTVADWLAARFAAAPNEALAAAMFSGGCPAKAVALLNGQALADRDALADEWRFFQRHGSLALFRTASRMAKIAPSLDALLAAWTIWLRDGLVCATAPERADLLINRDRAADLAAEAGALGAGALGACLEILIEARADTRRMVNPQLMIETLLLRIGPKLKPAAGSAAR
ncbi:MAG: DNA polymerase III subunit delta' [candidate division BRC1 bacterium ADurb.BinA364]|nr:MAG: DNA polymerase III subunit delta' [candidate division BRC1 bacterium ADurb.BinA364]